MKIALIGYGKMGKLIEEVALERGHEIVARVNSQGTWEGVENADVCIEFTNPESVMENLRKIALMGKNVVVGTTGWYDQLEEVKEMMSGVGVLYAPNFSVGVNILMQILKYSAHLINDFEQYGVSGIEYHHTQKKDAPSGTAKMIAALFGKKFEFASVREGSIPGIHTTIFDSSEDKISITHEAKGRQGFAKGAVEAAEWLCGKKGFYSVEDWLYGI